MSQTVFGAQAVVTMLNRAFTNSSPGNSVYQNQVNAAGTTAASQMAFANEFGASFAGLTDAQLATQVLGNLGVLPNAELEQAVADYFGSVGLESRGFVVLQLGQLLATLETAPAPQDIFNAAAVAWNAEVERAFIYSNDADNTIPQVGDFTTDATTLTRETDVATGSVFNGFLDYNKFTGNDEQTLTNSDRLTGTSGDTDVLFAQLQNATTRPRLDGIEILSIDLKANAAALDLTDTKGAKVLVNKGSQEAGILTFTNAANLVDVQIEGTSSDTAVAFTPSAVAGTADNLNLLLNGAGTRVDPSFVALGAGAAIAAGPVVTPGTGLESLTIKTSGAASVLGGVASDSVKTVTIEGDQNLSVGNKTAGSGFSSANITKVEAAAATGNLFVNLTNSSGQVQTVNLGTGNDTVVMTGVTAKDTVNGGNGTDRLVLTTASTNQAATLTDVEQIEARAAGTNINLINAAAVNLVAVAENASISNVTSVKSGLTFQFEADAVNNGANAAFGGVAYNLANATGATDVINVRFSNGGTAMAANSTVFITNLDNTGNNVETLNFNFADVGATNTVTVDDIDGGAGTALKTLNVTSDSKVVMNQVADLAKLTLVDASGVKAGFTAAFAALGDAAGATVKTGGSGVNNVTVSKAENLGATPATTNLTLTVDGTAGTGNQTFTVANADTNTTVGASAGAVVLGGTGADTISVNTVLNARSSIQAGAGTDNITLSGAGVDVLVLAMGDTGSSVATGDMVTGFGDANDLIDLRNFGFDVGLQTVAATGLLNGTANEFLGSAVAVANNGGNAVVYIDTNSDNTLGAGDLVLTLVGVAAGNITGADIIWS